MRVALVVVLALAALPERLVAQWHAPPVAARRLAPAAARGAPAVAPGPAAARPRRPWLRNLLVGTAVGGALGYGVGRTECARCDEPAPVYALTALGAGLGAVAGLAVTLTPNGARLRRWPGPAPAGLRPNEALQPTRRGEHRVAPGRASSHNRAPLARSAIGRAAELWR